MNFRKWNETKCERLNCIDKEKRFFFFFFILIEIVYIRNRFQSIRSKMCIALNTTIHQRKIYEDTKWRRQMIFHTRQTEIIIIQRYRFVEIIFCYFQIGAVTVDAIAIWNRQARVLNASNRKYCHGKWVQIVYCVLGNCRIYISMDIDAAWIILHVVHVKRKQNATNGYKIDKMLLQTIGVRLPGTGKYTFRFVSRHCTVAVDVKCNNLQNLLLMCVCALCAMCAYRSFTFVLFASRKLTWHEDMILKFSN